VAELRTEPVMNEALWRRVFEEGHPALQRLHRLHRRLPRAPRCRLCLVPFGGVGGRLMRLRGRRPSSRNRHYCNACDAFLQAHPGGAEVDVTLLFADIRRSVDAGARLAAADFARWVSGFFEAVTATLAANDGFVVEYRGDCVAGVYPPGFSGPDHADLALRTAERLVGPARPQAPDGTAIPLGVGVHRGPVFIGTLDREPPPTPPVSIFGHHVNVAARLSQMAPAGTAVATRATLAGTSRADRATDAWSVVSSGGEPLEVVHLSADAAGT
jgi:adenylate cyclase